MKYQNIADEYKDRGFVIFPRVFDAGEVLAVRNEVKRIFAEEPRLAGVDNPNIRTDAIARYPGLRQIFKSGRLVQSVRSILGEDCVMLPDVGMHDSCLLGGWHRDTGGLEKNGFDFHFSPEFQIVNVAFYLQENHQEYGGGLDIVPGSNSTKSSWWDNQKASNRKLKYVLSHLDRRGLLPGFVLHDKKGSMSIPSKSGDIVLFHTRCEHRPTHPKIMPVPEEHRKLAIFMLFSKNNEFATRYADFLSGLHPYWKNYKYPEGYFEEMRSIDVPLLPPRS